MASAKIEKVHTLSEYASQVEELLNRSVASMPNGVGVVNWYRGLGQSKSHKLTPGLYRHPSLTKIGDLLELEGKMMQSFLRQALLHTYQPTDTESAPLQQLLYMQHHGVPTRLLDWSSNPFIALYFALSDARTSGKARTYAEPAAVWVLNPFEWNKFALEGLSWGDRGPAALEDGDIKSYRPQGTTKHEMYPFPIALVGAANTQRMLAQRGVFTIFGRDTRPMETIFGSGFPGDSLVKLEIPPDRIGPMLQTLVAIGYTDSVAYPDLQGVAMEIKRMNGFLT